MTLLPDHYRGYQTTIALFTDVATRENEDASAPRRMLRTQVWASPAHGCLGFEFPGGHCSVRDIAFWKSDGSKYVKSALVLRVAGIYSF